MRGDSYRVWAQCISSRGKGTGAGEISGGAGAERRIGREVTLKGRNSSRGGG
jgi:hypothetical protein